MACSDQDVVLDTSKSFGEIYNNNALEFTRDLLEVSKLTIDRTKIEEWADNLRFLTPPLTTPIASQDGQTCCCSSFTPFTTIDLPYLELTSHGQVVDCVHYVAVSYCWPKGLQSHQKPFSIHTSTGDRHGKAPRDVLERAISFAIKHKLCFIWIDQECINQDDPVDKELGIQAMDAVYSKSHHTLGLLNTYLDDDSEVHALLQAIGRYNREGKRKGLGLPFNELIEGQETITLAELQGLKRVLEKLSMDKWLTRAWILHEAILSGNLITFMIQCDKAADTSTCGGINGEVLLKITDVKCLDNAFQTVYPNLKHKLEDPAATHQDILQVLLSKARNITAKLAISWKHYGYTNHSWNAIGPVNFLEFYGSERVADRLAIIGNICNYGVRLDTTELARRGYGFSVCMLCLMIMNGDISFFQYWDEVEKGLEFIRFPQHRCPPTPTTALTNASGSWDTFSWGPACSTGLLNLTKYQFATEPLRRFDLFREIPLRLSFSELQLNGWHMEGWIWTVQPICNAGEIMHDFQDDWNSFKASNLPLQEWSLGFYFIYTLFRILLVGDVVWLADLLWKRCVLDASNSWNQQVPRWVISSQQWVDPPSGPGNPPIDAIISREAAEDEEHVPDLPGSFIGANSPWQLSFLEFVELVQMSLRQSSSHWHWLIPQLMSGQTVGLGSLENFENMTDSDLVPVAIFEGINEGRVFVPRMRILSNDKLDDFITVFRLRPSSRRVEKAAGTTSSNEGGSWKSCGSLVRGIWAVHGCDSQKIILA